jgi:uroporphyrinogen-III synthase
MPWPHCPATAPAACSRWATPRLRDAAALADLARRLCDPAGLPLLLASGTGQGRPLAAALRAAGFALIRREVYAARPVAALPPAASAALATGQVETVLFFSTATARAFIDLLGAALPVSAVSGVEAVAISPATAAALSPLPWRRIRVASAPNQDAIMALMA